MFYDYLKLLWSWKENPTVDVERIACWAKGGRVIQEIDQRTGEIIWSMPARANQRSDNHKVTVTLTPSSLTVEGSPCRAFGQNNNVFGEKVPESLRACGKQFARLGRLFMLEGPGVALPSMTRARMLRVDITQNFALGSGDEVRQALAYLRQTEGGRFKIDARRGETVYWQMGSTIRSGKAYAKGPHLVRQVKRREAEASDAELKLADRLLRLELTLNREWFARRRRRLYEHIMGEWREAWEEHHGTKGSCEERAAFRAANTEQAMRLAYRDQWVIEPGKEFAEYFDKLIGGVEVNDMNVKDRIIAAAPTRNQGLSAYRTWLLIGVIGHSAVMDAMPVASWYRHRAILFRAGLSWGDLSAGNVVPLRKRAITASPVDSWQELRAA